MQTQAGRASLVGCPPSFLTDAVHYGTLLAQKESGAEAARVSVARVQYRPTEAYFFSQGFWQQPGAFSLQHLVFGQPAFSPPVSAETFATPGCSLACLSALPLSVAWHPANAINIPTETIRLNSFFMSDSPRVTHQSLGCPTPPINNLRIVVPYQVLG